MAQLGTRISELTHRATGSLIKHRNEPADRVAGLRAFALAGRTEGQQLQAWQIIAGTVAVVLPAAILTLLSADLPVSTPGIVLLFAVALSTYLAGWSGGITALIVTAVWLDLFFIGDRIMFNLPNSVSEGLTFAMILVIGFGLIMLIEQVKSESAIDRREANAARAATAALSTLEAASRGDAGIASEEQAMRLLLDAMLRANRAHGGMVLLYDETSGMFARVAQYGINDVGIGLPVLFPVDQGFAGRIAVERRPAMVERLSRSPLANDPILAYLGFESALGIPLVADDALQFIAVEQGHATAGHTDGRVPRRMAGGKGVDALFVIEHVDLGNGHAGGDGHLLDHVAQLAFIGMVRVGIDQPSTKRFGDGATAFGQGGGLIEAANDDDAKRTQHDVQEKLGIPQDEFWRRRASRLFGAGTVENQQTGHVDRRDDAQDGDHEVDHQHRRVLPGLVLVREEIHGLSRQTNDTLGASRCSRFSMANNSAAPKLKVPAMMLLGKTSRCVL